MHLKGLLEGQLEGVSPAFLVISQKSLFICRLKNVGHYSASHARANRTTQAISSKQRVTQTARFLEGKVCRFDYAMAPTEPTKEDIPPIEPEEAAALSGKAKKKRKLRSSAGRGATERVQQVRTGQRKRSRIHVDKSQQAEALTTSEDAHPSSSSESQLSLPSSYQQPLAQDPLLAVVDLSANRPQQLAGPGPTLHRLPLLNPLAGLVPAIASGVYNNFLSPVTTAAALPTSENAFAFPSPIIVLAPSNLFSAAPNQANPFLNVAAIQPMSMTPSYFGLSLPHYNPSLFPSNVQQRPNSAASSKESATQLIPNAKCQESGQGKEEHPTALHHLAQLSGTVVDAKGRKGPILYIPTDNEVLSESQILLRKQIEFFEVSMEDVGKTSSGRKHPIMPKQVGIQCRHCGHVPLRYRQKGAVYYPAKLSGIYQAAQNMGAGHLTMLCENIDETTKKQLLRFQQGRSGTGHGGKQYWADSARAQGVNESAGLGLVFADSISL
jgi:hypothetical protein